MRTLLYNKNTLSGNKSFYLYLFLGIWLLVNLIQASFTELAHDEAYYWMYSRQLAWGYFDHPPVIALLVRLGYAIFPNELGVRLFPMLMGVGTIFILYRLSGSGANKLQVFVLIAASVVLMQSHLGGFLAIPDIPVVFFSALFFLIYREYQQKDKIHYAILLGITGALMLYSKYHGVLILAFTLAAHWKIVKRKSFWIIPVIITIAMLPHLLWQIENGFPTFKYHLVSRSQAYRPDHTINYLYSQLAIAGPLISVLLFYHAFRSRWNTPFLRVLYVNMAGVFVFFFLMSFKGHVEAHWTAIGFIPLIVLAMHSLCQSAKAMKWLKWLAFPSIMFIVFIRIVLIWDVLPWKIHALHEVHHWDTWAQQIDSLAGNRPVVFVNSFQRPSKYEFYTRQGKAHTLNNVYYRKNQFNIWPIEDSLQGKSVLLLQSRNASDTLETVVGETYAYEFTDSFRSFFNLQIEPLGDEILSGRHQDTIPVSLSVFNPRSETVRFMSRDDIVGVYHNGRNWVKTKYIISLKDLSVMPGDSLILDCMLPLPEEPGNYSVYFAIRTRNQGPALNSDPRKLEVK